MNFYLPGKKRRNEQDYSQDVNVDPCVVSLSHGISTYTNNRWSLAGHEKCLSSVLHLDSVQQHMPDKVHLVNTPVVRLILVQNSTLHFLHFYFKFYI